MQDFAAKRRTLFECLDDASKELKGTVLDQSGVEPGLGRTIDEHSKRAKHPRIVHVQDQDGSLVPACLPEWGLRNMRGKESIFKKPELPIGKCLKPRKTPDYQINPHKWKKYSLLDADISDHSNTSAAFAFLKEMDEQRDRIECSDEGTDASAKKIEFKQISKVKTKLSTLQANEVPDEEVDRPKLRGSKLLMPEYVIGQRKETKKRKTPQTEKDKKSTACALRLSHLQEDDEEPEDG